MGPLPTEIGLRPSRAWHGPKTCKDGPKHTKYLCKTDQKTFHFHNLKLFKLVSQINKNNQIINSQLGVGDNWAISDFSQKHLTGNSWTYLRNFWYVMAFGLTMPKWYNTYVLQIFFKNIFSKNCKNIFDQIFTKKN